MAYESIKNMILLNGGFFFFANYYKQSLVLTYKQYD